MPGLSERILSNQFTCHSLSLSKSLPAGLLEDIGTLANEDRRGDSQGQRRAVGDVVVGTEDFSPAASR